MKNAYQQHHAAQIKKIVAVPPKNANDIVRRFVEQFYLKVPASELERMEPGHAVAVANSAFEFMAERKPGAPRIRIFAPEKKKDGYDSRHVVVELINDDMPFLVDSLTSELTRHGFTIHETIHPLFRVVRDKSGRLESLVPEQDKKTPHVVESLIHFEISALPEGLCATDLQKDLEWALEHVRAAVSDWKIIVGKVQDRIERLDKAAAHFDRATIDEVKDFLRWLTDRNFVFLGYAEYDFIDAKGKETFAVRPDSQLGILKITDEMVAVGLEALPPETRHFLLERKLIEITKSNRRSPVHRPVPMDYIGLKRFDTKGKVVGEARFLGLFTSNVYYQSADEIPLVRQKIAATLARSDFAPSSHDGKALKTILEFLPRDEIFQMSDDGLFETAMGILALEAKPGVRLFARRDAFERFISCMIFVPRERFSTELRYQIQDILQAAWGGSVSSFSTQITEAPLARLHLIVKTTPGDIPEFETSKLEHEIAKRAYMWGDLLLSELVKKYGEQKAEKLQRQYAGAFPQGYINRHDAAAGVHDIGKIEEAVASGTLSLELFRLKAEGTAFVHLKIYNPSEEIALSDILPLLENAGFRVIDEHPYLVMPQGGAQVWIRDVKMQVPGATFALEDVKPLLEEALLKVWGGEAENDRMNALVLKAQLSWRQVVMLRACAKYLKQAGFNYSQAAIEQALGHHPRIAKNIVELFYARFDPAEKDREAKQEKLKAQIEKQLSDVTNAAEDRILRRYVEILGAVLRTNYFQETESGAHKPVLSFKFASKDVPELPKPLPHAEIFVYSPRVEGIHLRGGKVARGGLRWSDRHEDFRTEVLGLMKAQMVKNSVIVPVGSKGGFVVKKPPQARDAYMEEGINCYKMYLSGLLDITDNIVKGKVTPPPQVVRHDEDDPYLVVAADKGTATFSDIANGVSAAYDFWLGDAFASGGSAGYDHKAMAITARGGWVSVVRHFREMGVDIAKTDFTVCGIGDMAGDVFGNGMILSKHIRLVAAFNHMHIFLDPNPDAKSSFEERKRLFKLPRSSWKDYDAEKISKGGGVFERSAKSIEISKEMQQVLGIHRSKLTPDDLIRAILLAPVDLLWNGGIGTYVKAEEESNDAVGDRANNALRVNGKDLRCKLVGEGGNLGFTQKGRIEYARNGGRINTDAIDNSAGVDCSDHEVNIKIAFSSEMAKGKLTLEKRNKLLASMTDEVADLVLKDNILQTQAITVAEQHAPAQLESHQRLIHTLEKSGLLDRAIEFLPSDKQFADLKTAHKGLTRPELAVLLAYGKMELYKRILESSLPDESYFTGDLMRYFPKAMQGEFSSAIESHRLKREIIATVATNSLVNRAGITFFFDMAEDSGASTRDIAAGYSVVRDMFGLRGMWNDIEACEGSVPVATQASMHAAINQFMERMLVWLLRNQPLPLDIDAITKNMAPAVADMQKHTNILHSNTTRREAEAAAEKLASEGVPARLAEKIASLEQLSHALNIIAVGRKSKLEIKEVGKIYFEIGARFSLGWLRLSSYKIAAGSHWERQAVQAMVGDLYDEQRRLTSAALDARDLEKWLDSRKDEFARYDAFIEDLKLGETLDIPKLMVALKHVRSLASI